MLAVFFAVLGVLFPNSEDLILELTENFEANTSTFDEHFVSSWKRCDYDFEKERVILQMPGRPHVQHDTKKGIFTATKISDRSAYWFTGCLPSRVITDPTSFLEDIVIAFGKFPWQMISSDIYQSERGYWVLDAKYIKSEGDYMCHYVRCIVTPHNCYFLQSLNGSSFNRFKESFHIVCEEDGFYEEEFEATAYQSQ